MFQYTAVRENFLVVLGDFTSTVCLLLSRLYGFCDYSHARGSLWLYWDGKSRCTVIVARHLLRCTHNMDVLVLMSVQSLVEKTFFFLISFGM
jgi:hypothetical protein